MSLASYSEFSSSDVALPGPAKAAVLLLAMGTNGASRLMKHFSPEDLRAMKESVAEYRDVSAEQVDQLVSDFQEEFKTGAGLSDLDDGMNRLLRSVLSADEMTNIFGADDFIDQSLFTGPTLTVWEEMEKLGAPVLRQIMSAEHPQVAATLLAKLEPEIAAAVVAGLEGDFRVDVMRRMLEAKELGSATEMLVEEKLREIFVAGSSSAERKARRAALAEIANRMEKAQTDELLASIEEDEPDEATAIRSLLFAFEDLPNVPKKARLILFDSIPTENVTLALRGASPEVTESVTSALAARARRMVEAELAQNADVSVKDVTAARRAIATLALRLAAEGRIVLTAAKEG
ncbi:FliG C-terminal domain-containing protein [Aureimonas leprariae]|uniref:Flagellar motor switch protein FliG n=1 Tax=Plantimonas leprariae TaxID=2615207 RepID=A0A7V7PKN7_9HYPH|nr:FliG C-terminal domain-containing protein [Aureimonas leprariae]KAB0676527.1 flagellar motor switch protein FliG [Aureimonas leprariae]